ALISRMGKKNSIVLGNTFQAISVLILIFFRSMPLLYLREFFNASSFSFKRIADQGILRDSIPKGNCTRKYILKDPWKRSGALLHPICHQLNSSRIFI
ncbi:MAG: hypothetical protein FWC68_00810, partial [Oscillospiraceae bacterium]|nr:hypothetical protein [Oscillospiraceae bacterium]